MSIFDDQRKMMQAFGQQVGTTDIGQAELYIKLIEEEYHETMTAFAEMLVEIDNRGITPEDVVEVADGLIDMLVVIAGAGISLGLPMRSLWNEVHRSNMSKIGPGGKIIRRDDGKVLKPDTYSPPNLLPIIKHGGK